MYWYAKSNKDLDVNYNECKKSYVQKIVSSILKEIWSRFDLEKIKDEIKDKTSSEKDKISKHQVGEVEGVKIFLVNGNEVKIKFFMDFVEGGNDMVYGKKHEGGVPSYIPSEEIWIDADLDISSFPYVLLHECVERHMMKNERMDYEHAHERANGIEKHLRKQNFFESRRG